MFDSLWELTITMIQNLLGSESGTRCSVTCIISFAYNLNFPYNFVNSLKLVPGKSDPQCTNVLLQTEFRLVVTAYFGPRNSLFDLLRARDSNKVISLC